MNECNHLFVTGSKISNSKNEQNKPSFQYMKRMRDMHVSLNKIEYNKRSKRCKRIKEKFRKYFGDNCSMSENEEEQQLLASIDRKSRKRKSRDGDICIACSSMRHDIKTNKISACKCNIHVLSNNSYKDVKNVTSIKITPGENILSVITENFISKNNTCTESNEQFESYMIGKGIEQNMNQKETCSCQSIAKKAKQIDMKSAAAVLNSQNQELSDADTTVSIDMDTELHKDTDLKLKIATTCAQVITNAKVEEKHNIDASDLSLQPVNNFLLVNDNNNNNNNIVKDRTTVILDRVSITTQTSTELSSENRRVNEAAIVPIINTSLTKRNLDSIKLSSNNASDIDDTEIEIRIKPGLKTHCMKFFLKMSLSSIYIDTFETNSDIRELFKLFQTNFPISCEISTHGNTIKIKENNLLTSRKICDVDQNVVQNVKVASSSQKVEYDTDRITKDNTNSSRHQHFKDQITSNTDNEDAKHNYVQKNEYIQSLDQKKMQTEEKNNAEPVDLMLQKRLSKIFLDDTSKINDKTINSHVLPKIASSIDIISPVSSVSSLPTSLCPSSYQNTFTMKSATETSSFNDVSSNKSNDISIGYKHKLFDIGASLKNCRSILPFLNQVGYNREQQQHIRNKLRHESRCLIQALEDLGKIFSIKNYEQIIDFTVAALNKCILDKPTSFQEFTLYAPASHSNYYTDNSNNSEHSKVISNPSHYPFSKEKASNTYTQFSGNTSQYHIESCSQLSSTQIQIASEEQYSSRNNNVMTCIPRSNISLTSQQQSVGNQANGSLIPYSTDTTNINQQRSSINSVNVPCMAPSSVPVSEPNQQYSKSVGNQANASLILYPADTININQQQSSINSVNFPCMAPSSVPVSEPNQQYSKSVGNQANASLIPYPADTININQQQSSINYVNFPRMASSSVTVSEPNQQYSKNMSNFSLPHSDVSNVKKLENYCKVMPTRGISNIRNEQSPYNVSNVLANSVTVPNINTNIYVPDYTNKNTTNASFVINDRHQFIMPTVTPMKTNNIVMNSSTTQSNQMHSQKSLNTYSNVSYSTPFTANSNTSFPVIQGHNVNAIAKPAVMIGSIPVNHNTAEGNIVTKNTAVGTLSINPQMQIPVQQKQVLLQQHVAPASNTSAVTNQFSQYLPNMSQGIALNTTTGSPQYIFANIQASTEYNTLQKSQKDITDSELQQRYMQRHNSINGSEYVSKHSTNPSKNKSRRSTSKDLKKTPQSKPRKSNAVSFTRLQSDVRQNIVGTQSTPRNLHVELETVKVSKTVMSQKVTVPPIQNIALSNATSGTVASSNQHKTIPNNLNLLKSFSYSQIISFYNHLHKYFEIPITQMSIAPEKLKIWQSERNMLYLLYLFLREQLKILNYIENEKRHHTPYTIHHIPTDKMQSNTPQRTSVIKKTETSSSLDNSGKIHVHGYNTTNKIPNKTEQSLNNTDSNTLINIKSTDDLSMKMQKSEGTKSAETVLRNRDQINQFLSQFQKDEVQNTVQINKTSESVLVYLLNKPIFESSSFAKSTSNSLENASINKEINTNIQQCKDVKNLNAQQNHIKDDDCIPLSCNIKDKSEKTYNEVLYVQNPEPKRHHVDTHNSQQEQYDKICISSSKKQKLDTSQDTLVDMINKSKTKEISRCDIAGEAVESVTEMQNITKFNEQLSLETREMQLDKTLSPEISQNSLNTNQNITLDEVDVAKHENVEETDTNIETIKEELEDISESEYTKIQDSFYSFIDSNNGIDIKSENNVTTDDNDVTTDNLVENEDSDINVPTIFNVKSISESLFEKMDVTDTLSQDDLNTFTVKSESNSWNVNGDWEVLNEMSKKACFRCRQKSTVLCANCLKAAYCSQHCMNLHWKAKHYMECESYTDSSVVSIID